MLEFRRKSFPSGKVDRKKYFEKFNSFIDGSNCYGLRNKLLKKFVEIIIIFLGDFHQPKNLDDNIHCVSIKKHIKYGKLHKTLMHFYAISVFCTFDFSDLFFIINTV